MPRFRFSVLPKGVVIVLVLNTLATIGCAGSERSPLGLKPVERSQKSANDATAGRNDVRSDGSAAQDALSALPKPPPQAKIIYQATVKLWVQNLDVFADELASLVNKFQGYIAGTEFTGASYASRQGTWRIRVPSESLNTFLREVSRLGELENTSLQSQDVTEEYYDLELRLNVAKAEEKRLLQLLETTAGNLTDVLAVEKELHRVRTEVERLTGLMRRVSHLVQYSTVTVTAYQRSIYVPETVPDFTTRWTRTLQMSWASLWRFGENTLIVVAWILPWLPLIAVVFVVAVLLVRVTVRRLAALAGPRNQTTAIQGSQGSV